MARPLRVHLPHVVYHVMSRGNAKQEIFTEDADHAQFLALLGATSSRFDVGCLAYCLMPNHFHLLLKPRTRPVSRLMQQLNASYCQWFNRRHGRVGHVLQGRFKARLVESPNYFLQVLCYIVLNPVRANLVATPSGWQWSSFRATAGLEDPPDFLTLGEVWALLGETDAVRARRKFVQFATEADSPGLQLPPLVIGSEAFALRIAPELDVHRADPEIGYSDKFAARPGLSQLLTTTDRSSLGLQIRQAFLEHGYTLREIAEFFGCHPSTVWRRMRRAGRPLPGLERTNRLALRDSADETASARPDTSSTAPDQPIERASRTSVTST